MEFPDNSTSTDQPTGTDEAEDAYRASKRQRQLSRSPPLAEVLAAELGHDPESIRSRQTLQQPPNIRGSSRDTNEMHRSSPEASGSIKYTRTGRVSKATKGQRVHHCEECGKTYTRAEHLRRHQQNHKPGAFPCDYPNCSRSFYREDLLIRHRARHNDPLHPPSRRHSVGSQSSAPDGGGLVSAPASAATSTPGLPPPPTSEPLLLAPELQEAPPDNSNQQSNPSSRAPKRVPIPPNELSFPSAPLTVDGGGLTSLRDPWNLTSPLSSLIPHDDHGYESPDESMMLPYYPHARARYSSDASVVYGQATSASRSPVSAGSSSNMSYSQWSAGCQGVYRPMFDAYQIPYALRNPQLLVTIPYGGPGVMLPAEIRDEEESLQLELPEQHFPSMNYDAGGENAYQHEQYVDAYWAGIHELYPVIHRPTYDHASASPLLRAAVLALGAHTLGGRAHISDARLLHEKCLKVLKNRIVGDKDTYRTCDMQAVVLVELYSIFKSRRPPLQFSKSFERVCQYLSNDHAALSFNNSSTPPQRDNHQQPSLEELLRLETLCKQRLLSVCFMLEQQHNFLFGRLSNIGPTDLSSILPFPASQSHWDAVSDIETPSPNTSTYDRLSDALSAVSNMSGDSTQTFDAFQSMLLMMRMCDSANDGLYWTNSDSSMLSVMEQSSRVKLAYHTFELCKSAPVRQLLAVAGESWVMAEKLTTQADYTGAQFDVRQWISGTSSDNMGMVNERSIDLAMQHALHILKTYQNAPRTGLLFQEWSVHLAVVTIWAYEYSVRKTEDTRPTSCSDSIEREPSPNELEQTITALISIGPKAVLNWEQTRNVLRWAKMRIARGDVPHTCGLVSGSLDVLGKLIQRGNDDGWF